MPTALPAATRLTSTPRTSQQVMPGFVLLAILGLTLGSMILTGIKMSPRSLVQAMQVVGQSAACESGSCLVETATQK